MSFAHMKMPEGSIENTLPICPCCHNTKSVEVDSTVKMCSPPIYTAICKTCLISWETNLSGRVEKVL